MSIFDTLGLGGLLGYHFTSNYHQYSQLNNQQEYMNKLNQYLNQQNKENIKENNYQKDYVDVEFEVLEQKLLGEVKCK
jgi:hypothetical protein